MTVAHPRFPHLFSPLRIKGATLRNRIAVTAHYAWWWREEGGLPGDAFRAYVEERAKGGIGLFVIGATATRYDGGPNWLLNVDERIIPRYRAVVEAGHRHGCAIFAQLIYRSVPPQPGAQLAGVRGAVPRAPAAPPPPLEVPPPPHTVEDLQGLVASFGRAAARALAGGVDGLELHAHEGHLHAEFLSPRWKIRTDKYGGSLENRMRLLVETLQVMRTAINTAGAAAPLGVRLKADDLAPGGMSLEEYLELIHRLETLGLVDYLSLTAGDYALHHGPMYRPDGEWLPLAARIRERSQLPIMHAGRITDPFLAEQTVATGQVDVVGMTKTHIADPHFTRKVYLGQLDDIRYCMRCLQSCIGKSQYMTCVYNPVTSRERQWADLQPAARRKRVVVIGAGPAGMEAALVAAQRGHEVVVLERTNRVGGQALAAAASPLRRKFGEVAAYYERQVRKGLFDLRLETEAVAESVVPLRPDAVVIATGSAPRRVTVPIAGHMCGRPASTVLDALAMTVDEGRTATGDRDGDTATQRRSDGASEISAAPVRASPRLPVPASSVVERAVVVDREGHMRAFVVADFLNDRGVDVEFLTPYAEPGPSLDHMNQGELCERLAARGVRFHPGQDVLWWQDARTLVVHDVYANDRRLIPDVDLLAIAAGSDPLTGIASAVAAQAPQLELHVIGDACSPRTVEEATYQGARIGRLL